MLAASAVSILSLLCLTLFSNIFIIYAKDQLQTLITPISNIYDELSTSSYFSAHKTVTDTSISFTNGNANFYRQSEIAPGSEFCFYADSGLCQQINVRPSKESQQRLLLHGGAAESGPGNPCMCRQHPNASNSWFCCNVTDIAMISSCRLQSNNSNWLHLHIHNMTILEVDLSLSIFQTLHSLAITNGNITRLVKSFSRVSQIKCLDFSNNNLSSISIRVPPFLKFLNISYNNLTQLPKMKQQLNITLDVR